MTSSHDTADLDRQRNAILNQLAGLGDLRPGTLAPRYRRCGKPGCHCARKGDPGHGPKWQLTWKKGTKGRTSIIPEDAVERTREQIAEYVRARVLMRDLIDVSTRLCEARLEANRPAKAEKKGASSRRSRRKPGPRSNA